MATLWRDVRFAIRTLTRSPGFSVTVILSLALGIGANTAIFSLVEAFLLRPMPVDHPERLVAIYLTAPRWSGDIANFSYPDLLDYRKQDTGLSDLMGSNGIPLTLNDREKPELIWGEVVTGNYFSGLGVHPVVGRGFLPDEDRNPGEKPVCVLSYNFWKQRFQGDTSIAGKIVKINGQALTVVGVAPRGFIGTLLFSFVPDVWIPVMMQKAIAPADDFLAGRDNRWISLRGRLKPGVSRSQAEAAMNVVARQLAKAYPQTDRDLSVHLISGGARVQPYIVANGAVSITTGIMTGVVILVLLIACANVANLMFTRSAARAREMAIRVAVGASRGQLVRELLTESVVLSLAGGALGLLLAFWLSDQSRLFYPSLDFQTADLDYQMQLDPRIFPFTLLIALFTAVIFGLLPALRASKVDPVAAMKGESASVSIGRWRIGRGNFLIMAQAALSCVLLICGGLFLRSMQFARTTDPGFDRSGIDMFSLDLDLQGYDKARGLLFQKDLLDRMRHVPGVESASLASPLPLDAYDMSTLVLPEGYVPRSDDEQNFAGLSRVGAHYFDTMGTKIIAGRPINERDTAASPRVAVINETLARRYWDTPERAIGRRFAIDKKGTMVEFVGVARNGKYATYGEPATMYYFSPLAQDYTGRTTVLLRSKLPPDGLMPGVRREIAALDSTLPIYGIRTMPQFLTRLLTIYDMGASLIGTFAVMALLLAAVGIYGVVHFNVSRRTREIGIRMALGARAGGVLRLVLQRSLIWVASGILVGVAIALGAGSVTSKILAGVSGTDALTFAAVVAIFAAIALAATILPARRATHVDPMQVLRYD